MKIRPVVDEEKKKSAKVKTEIKLKSETEISNLYWKVKTEVVKRQFKLLTKNPLYSSWQSESSELGSKQKNNFVTETARQLRLFRQLNRQNRQFSSASTTW